MGNLISDAFRIDLDRCEANGRLVRDLDSFKNWIRMDACRLLPHGVFAAVHDGVYGIGVSPGYIVTVDFLLQHLLAIRNASGHVDTPLASRWFELQRPVFFDEHYPPEDISEAWLRNFRESDLRNAAADGVLDKTNCIATYFSFHQFPALDEPALCRTFEAVTPVRHLTFARIIRRHEESVFTLNDYEQLSALELQIPDYPSKGKGNCEISKLLSLCDNTGRNHVSRILDRIGRPNRQTLRLLWSRTTSRLPGQARKCYSDVDRRHVHFTPRALQEVSVGFLEFIPE